MDKSKDKKKDKKDKKDGKDKKGEKNKEKSLIMPNSEAEEHEEKPLDVPEDLLSEIGRRSLSSHLTVIEPYVCTGNFVADYEELCRRNEMSYVPSIVNRVKVPLQTVTTPVEQKNEKVKEKNKGPVEVETEHSDENKEPLPKTYVLNNSYEYFKPRIQVAMENTEKPETITEIHIRGWKMSEEYLNVFQLCWPCMEKLNTLNLWNTGLDGESITFLASLLPKCVNLKKLFLDATHVKEENYGELLGKESLIENVSFRHCQMTSKGAESISKALFDKEAIKLTSLNLSGNFIGDQGIKYLTDALRINRTLLVLGLSNNNIEDTGAKYIAEVVSRIMLTQAEVVERRKLLAERREDGAMKSASPPVSRRSETRDPTAVGSRGTPVTEKDKSAKKGAKGKKQDPKGKEEDKATKGKRDREDKSGGGGGAGAAGTGGSGGGGGGGGGAGAGGAKKGSKEAERKVMKNVLAGKGVAKTPGDVEMNEGTVENSPWKKTQIQSPTDPVFPLLETAEYSEIDKQLYIPGNRMLKLLDLSRNKITSKGMKYLVDAMQIQAELCQEQTFNIFPGLLKLRIKKNQVSEECEHVKELHKLMLIRDPFLKQNNEIQ